MQEAINTRENAIMDAGYEYAFAMRDAMEKRKTGLSRLWVDTEVSNRSQHQKVWQDWRKDSQAARAELRADRDAAWRTFRETAQRTCRATLPREESAAQDAAAAPL
jgi:hypothetical protein